MLSAFPEFPGALDYKLSPSNHLLVACVYEGDVWLLDSQTARSHQLTHTAGTSLVLREVVLHFILVYSFLIFSLIFKCFI